MDTIGAAVLESRPPADISVYVPLLISRISVDLGYNNVVSREHKYGTLIETEVTL
jgi:hypothetical protein